MVNQETITTNNIVFFYSCYDGLTMVNQETITTNNIVFFTVVMMD